MVVNAGGERRASQQQSRNTQRNTVAAQKHNTVAEQQQQQYNDRAESSNKVQGELNPTIGELKCNVDAAVFKDVNMFSAGMCIRDDKGRFIRAQAIWSSGQLSPQEAEAWGLKQALLWLIGLGYTRVSVELDCKLVVDGMKGSPIQRTEFFFCGGQGSNPGPCILLCIVHTN